MPIQAILTIFPILMVYAACSDILTMTIANWISITLAIAFFALAALSGLPLMLVLAHGGAGLGVLTASFALFAARLIGGGDAKLAAAAALWLGPAQLPGFALDAALIGGALALALLLFRQTPLPAWGFGAAWIARLHNRAIGVPYGVALAAAALMQFPAAVAALDAARSLA